MPFRCLFFFFFGDIVTMEYGMTWENMTMRILGVWKRSFAGVEADEH